MIIIPILFELHLVICRTSKRPQWFTRASRFQ